VRRFANIEVKNIELLAQENPRLCLVDRGPGVRDQGSQGPGVKGPGVRDQGSQGPGVKGPGVKGPEGPGVKRDQGSGDQGSGTRGQVSHCNNLRQTLE
jgi:hypothetical protein